MEWSAPVAFFANRETQVGPRAAVPRDKVVLFRPRAARDGGDLDR